MCIEDLLKYIWRENVAELNEEKCIACSKNASPVSELELAELQRQTPQWQIAARDGISRLERVFQLRNFTEALQFTNKIGELAEQEHHHPAILTEWGKVTVTWWTHAIGGLHRNDFVMAAKTDTLFALKT
jgi:4a-hydroxytetrahydrobiopterin dehydratase